MRRLLPAAVLASLLWVTGAAGTHGQNVWSGQWTANTGGVGFRLVDDAEGIAAIKTQGGKPCPGSSDYYRGGYYSPGSGAGGKVTGCTEGSSHLVGRYVGDSSDPSASGDFDIRFVPPNKFTGIYTPDSTKTSSPYTGTFKAHFAGDGCCTRATLRFDYAMPQRFGLDRNSDGLVDYLNDRRAVDPSKWRVEFTIPGCDKSTVYHWKVDGHSASFGLQGACIYAHDFAREGKYRVEVSVGPAGKGATFAEDVVVQDWLMVGLGDSVGSGEGNPDVPKQGEKAARWESARCDRSANSFEARAALTVEQRDPRTSVTFVHLACSGAAIRTGIVGGYWGITPGDLKFPLEAQLAALKKVVGEREIDAVIISIGANDVGFGPVLEFCVKHQDCPNTTYENGKTLAEVIAVRLQTLPGLYDELAQQLSPLVASNRVYLNQYPDELRDQNGDFCDDMIDIANVRAIRADEAKWMYDSFMLPLNATIATVARAHGWKVITGGGAAFHDHGYCAGDQGWVVTIDQSKASQGDKNGTMHPNGTGHRAMSVLVGKVLRPDLYPAGKPRLPTP